MTSQYTPVRVSTLRGDQKIGFDLYIQLNERFVHYCRQGTSFDLERIQRLKKKRVRKLFIPHEQEKEYQVYIARNLEKAFKNNPQTPLRDRTQIVQGATQAAVEVVFEDPASEKAYQNAKNISQRYTHFLLDNGDALKSVMEIQNTDKDLVHHGITVASLSVKLAHELGFTDQKQLELLALGASLHDFGLYSANIDWQKPESEMTKEELAEYQQHPKLGAETLKTKKHLDQVVLAIIMEHEELSNGRGFPQGLAEMKIDKLALIVGICDFFDEFMFMEGLSQEEAIKKFSFEAIGKYPLEHVNGLKKILSA